MNANANNNSNAMNDGREAGQNDQQVLGPVVPNQSSGAQDDQGAQSNQGNQADQGAQARSNEDNQAGSGDEDDRQNAGTLARPSSPALAADANAEAVTNGAGQDARADDNANGAGAAVADVSPPSQDDSGVNALVNLRDNLNDTKLRVTVLQEEYDKLKDEASNTETQKQAEIKQLNAQITQLQEEKADLQTDRDNEKYFHKKWFKWLFFSVLANIALLFLLYWVFSWHLSLRSDAARMSQALSGKTQENTDLQARTDELSKSVSDKELAIKDLEAKISDTAKRMDFIENERRSFQEQLIIAKSNILNKHFEDFVKDLAKDKLQCQDIKDYITALANNMSTQEFQCQGFQKRINELSNEMLVRQTQCDTSLDQCRSSNHDCNSLHEQCMGSLDKFNGLEEVAYSLMGKLTPFGLHGVFYLIVLLVCVASVILILMCIWRRQTGTVATRAESEKDPSESEDSDVDVSSTSMPSPALPLAAPAVPTLAAPLAGGAGTASAAPMHRRRKARAPLGATPAIPSTGGAGAASAVPSVSAISAVSTVSRAGPASAIASGVGAGTVPPVSAATRAMKASAILACATRTGEVPVVEYYGTYTKITTKNSLQIIGQAGGGIAEEFFY